MTYLLLSIFLYTLLGTVGAVLAFGLVWLASVCGCVNDGAIDDSEGV